jgi:regulator of sirC expression with transglutaminase-like and TPR domain
MFKQREAIIRLLKDDDPETVRLTKRQLAEGGPETIGDLRDLLALDDEQVASHIREILAEVEGRSAKQRFERVCTQVSNTIELEEASWLLAQIFLPTVEIQPYRQLLDSWGAELRRRLVNVNTDTSRIQLIADFLGKELDFHGNEDAYYDVRNSLIPCVIDSRLGIPISLCVLYMFVGRRASIALEGVNLPGHFVGCHGTVLFDCFYRGEILTAHDCARILARQGHTLDPKHLQPAHPKLIMMRILANLLHIFEREDDKEQQQLVASWIRLMNPSAR